MRVINESRPTPIDRLAARAFVDDLTQDLLTVAEELTKAGEQEYLDDHAEIVRSEYTVLDVKTREKLTFPIVISSYVDSPYVNRGDLVPSAHIKLDDTAPRGFQIELIVNGAYTPSKLKELRSYLVDELYTRFIHELTHAAEKAYDPHEKPAYSNADGTVDLEKYWSDPREVRAYLQQVVDEALRRAESFDRARDGKQTREQMIAHLRGGEWWKRCEQKLDATDMAKVMRAVYAALSEAGLL